MRIASWNINSVRARIHIVDQFLKTYEPDVLCLQEIKVMTELFPAEFFHERGYVHQAIFGQKNHHGVATVSRVPLIHDERVNWCEKGDARHVRVGLKHASDRVLLDNFYVPAGGDIPDSQANDKFAHKLSFMDEMTDWSEGLREPTILVGDLNVAPLPSDVWSHKALLNVVSHTPVETGKMENMLAAHNWIDAMREITPAPDRLYSWWSYRAKDWRASDRGRRLDHVWLSPELKSTLKDCRVIEDARGWEKPSDHAPVIADLDL